MTQHKYRNNISEIYTSNKSVVQMRYDTVKAYGGEIKGATREDDGTTFIIQLPIV